MKKYPLLMYKPLKIYSDLVSPCTIVVPAPQKPFERVLVATFMLRIFSFSELALLVAENSPPVVRICPVRYTERHVRAPPW